MASILLARISWQVKYQNHFIKARKTSDNSYTNRQVTRNEVRFYISRQHVFVRGVYKKNRGGWGGACTFQLYYLNLIKFNFNKGTPCPPPFLDPRMLAVHTNEHSMCISTRFVSACVCNLSLLFMSTHVSTQTHILMTSGSIKFNLEIFGFVLLYFESLENT